MDTKPCRKCRQTKPLDDFAPGQRAKPRGMCRECMNKSQRSRYARAKARGVPSDSAKKVVRLIAAAKAKRCTDCKRCYPSYVMELDPPPGETTIVFSKAVSYSPERVTAEIEKCDVVCLNCLRVRRYKRGEGALRVAIVSQVDSDAGNASSLDNMFGVGRGARN